MSRHRRPLAALALLLCLSLIAPSSALAASEPPRGHRPTTLWERIESLFIPSWFPLSEKFDPQSGASVGGEGEESEADAPDSDGLQPHSGASVGGEGEEPEAGVPGQP